MSGNTQTTGKTARPVGEPVLDVSNLTIETGPESAPVQLVRDISFTLHAGEVLAIVGESGSGKSLTMLAATGLLPDGVRATSGTVTLEGRTIVENGRFIARDIRGRQVGMIFQDPLTSLNPVKRVSTQIAEAIRVGAPTRMKRADIVARCEELLVSVGLSDVGRMMPSYPHELSGGQRQRVMTAIAMANRPVLLIADEPTTALDVTIQKQVLDALETVRAENGSAMILVTHDLGLVAQHADRVLVLYGGVVMETAPVMETFLDPIHPYTVGLLGSVLTTELGDGRAPSIPGQIPPPGERPAGCPFATRCAVADGRDACWEVEPVFATWGDPADEHHYSCHFGQDALDFRSRTHVLADLKEDIGVD